VAALIACLGVSSVLLDAGGHQLAAERLEERRDNLHEALPFGFDQYR